MQAPNLAALGKAVSGALHEGLAPAAARLQAAEAAVEAWVRHSATAASARWRRRDSRRHGSATAGRHSDARPRKMQL